MAKENKEIENEENKENTELENDPKNEGKGKKTKEAKAKKEGALSLPVIIGISVGAVVLIIASVVVGSIVASKLFPTQGGGAVLDTANITAAIQKANREILEAKTKEGKTPEEIDEMEAEKMSNMPDILVFETGKIVSNPRGNANVFIVLELALDFRVYDEENKTSMEIVKIEGKDEAATREINFESTGYKKLKTRITSNLNELIATYSEAEFQAMRGDLKNIIRTQLRPVFRNFGLQLGEVQIVTFLIQPN
ncbi:MAG: hypothetical protein GX372_01740 [Ignavibacteria bacterium]|jgi:flagellar basal body-associated protein FliL|nr:hypothetical protein [Ignavibacteria bacterium]